MYQGVVNVPDTGDGDDRDHHDEDAEDYEAVSYGTVKGCFKEYLIMI